MTIYEQLKVAGVPLDHHESDLYVKVTGAARAILDGWKRIGWHVKSTTFRSLADGELWYDIPFAYDPWWTERRTAHAT